MPFDAPATSSSAAAAYPSRPTPSFTPEPPAGQPSAPKSLMTVTLEAVSDPTSSSSRARRLRVAPHDVPVTSLREAREVVERFVRVHRVGRPSFGPSCGLVRRDGKPVCQVDYELRLWRVDARGEVTGHEIDEAGGVVGFDQAGGGR